MTNIPNTILRELKVCGLAWEVKNGGKHEKLFVGGKLAGILSRGKNEDLPFAVMNLRASVRRIIREAQNTSQ